MEYKLGDVKSKKNILGTSQRSKKRNVNKGQTSRVEKLRNREKIERQRIVKENRDWGHAESPEQVPLRANNNERAGEYSASKRRLR
jgi:hypothetical protein